MTEIRQKHDKDMLLATIPLILCGTVLYGPRVLLVTAVATVVARFVDVVVSMARKTEFDSTDNSSVLAAMVFILMLPANIPLYIVAITVGLTILIGKHLFGGKDVYPFNLAALAMCCAAVNWPDAVFSAVKPFTKISFFKGTSAYVTASNASILKDGGVPSYDLFDLALGNYPGSMGADFVIIIIALGIFLLAKKRISWQVPVTFLVTCGAIAFLFPRIYGFTRIESLVMEVLTGQGFYIALFMLNEPTTTPRNPKAKIIFGFMAGVLGMLFRYFGSFEIGTCFALLLVNTLDGFIDRLVADREKIKVKPAESHAEKPVKAQPKQKGSTMAMISEAEDSIDQVLYSTRTIDINEVLRMEEMQKKQGKAGKHNEK